MSIRKAELKDAPYITRLLDQLDYPGSDDFIREKMKAILSNLNEELLVYETEGKVVGFIIVTFLTQLGLKGDIARIGYFSVDENYRNKRIGKQLEEYIEQLAKAKHCDRIEVHCHERRKEAHKFYYRQGYFESPKYLMKSLDKE
jgi:GNAT superfamily N-acetyltransferase